MYVEVHAMKEISMLIKPASSLCNLRCRYCFYADVSENRDVASTGVMTDETLETLVSRIAEELQEQGKANISFQGGEPTVAGLDYFKKFASLLDAHPGIEVHWSMQTNATLLTEEFAQFLHERNFLLGISLDGYQSMHDSNRYDAEKKGAFYRVMKGISLLEKAKVEYNILTVVTHELSKHPKALFSFYKEHHFDYIQLIPCLPELNGDTRGLALLPEDYASFYNTFFDCWKKDFEKGGWMSVNLFENIAGMMQGFPPYQCGYIGRCTTQFVIESNGDVYPCDFYCLDEKRLGNLNDLSFAQMRETPQAKEFMATSKCTKAPCEGCPYVRTCNGGCRRQNVCWLTDDICAYREVLDHIVPQMTSIMRRSSS